MGRIRRAYVLGQERCFDQDLSFECPRALEKIRIHRPGAVQSLHPDIADLSRVGDYRCLVDARKRSHILL
jgi:hypothetical protein